MRKVTRRVICSVCKKIRFVSMQYEDIAQRRAFLSELSAAPYVCSDHADDREPPAPAKPPRKRP